MISSWEIDDYERDEKAWKILADKVRKRDNYTCFKCNFKSKSISVHHLLPKKFGGEDFANNLICLCNKHHKQLDNLYLRYGITQTLLRIINDARKRSL